MSSLDARYERLSARPEFHLGLRLSRRVRVLAADPEDLQQEGHLLLWKLLRHYHDWEDDRILACWGWAYRNRLFDLYRVSVVRAEEPGTPTATSCSNPWPGVHARLALDSLATIASETDSCVLEAFRAGAESVSAAARFTGLSRRGVNHSLGRLKSLLKRGAAHAPASGYTGD